MAKWIQVRPSNLKPEDYLFHYTTGAGLHGIVTSGHLRASHHRFMNDASEVEFGFQAVTALLQRIVHRQLSDADSRLSRLVDNGFDFETSAAAVAGTIQHVLYSTLGGYLSCLCSHSEKQVFDHGLLSQWRGYGGDGGYAIRFKVAELKKYLDGVPATSVGVTVGLDQVRYGHEANERPLSKELEAKLGERLIRYLENPLGGKDSFGLEEFADMESLEEIMDYSLYTKNDHFSEEREWRIAAICSRDLKEGREKYFTRNGDVVPFLELQSAMDITECIDGIIVGPHPNQDARCESVWRMMASKGQRVSVHPTGIPLRSG